MEQLVRPAAVPSSVPARVPAAAATVATATVPTQCAPLPHLSLGHSCLPVLSPTSRVYAWWALLMLLLDLTFTGEPG